MVDLQMWIWMDFVNFFKQKLAFSLFFINFWGTSYLNSSFQSSVGKKALLAQCSAVLFGRRVLCRPSLPSNGILFWFRRSPVLRGRWPVCSPTYFHVDFCCNSFLRFDEYLKCEEYWSPDLIVNEIL